jgi:hypothetical protein
MGFLFDNPRPPHTGSSPEHRITEEAKPRRKQQRWRSKPRLVWTNPQPPKRQKSARRNRVWPAFPCKIKS